MPSNLTFQSSNHILRLLFHIWKKRRKWEQLGELHSIWIPYFQMKCNVILSLPIFKETMLSFCILIFAVIFHFKNFIIFISKMINHAPLWRWKYQNPNRQSSDASLKMRQPMAFYLSFLSILELIHHAEKPENFISDLINCGIYLFNQSFKSIFEATL